MLRVAFVSLVMASSCLTPLLSAPAAASMVERSQRPILRPTAAEPLLVVQLASAASVNVSLRPMMRSAVKPSTPMVQQVAVSNVRYERWKQSFRGRAISQGIPTWVLDQALGQAEYLPRVIELDRNQSEFTKTLWDYLGTAVSDSRVRNGKAALRENRRVLEQIEARYGVPKEIVVAVWGLETSYGSFMGGNNVISSLTTLAFDGRRGAYFEKELINALKILAARDTRAGDMSGSWAGAMGHTQFMPSSYLQYAVDFTGDGRRDIWAKNPTDALASTANYLKRHGWVSGQPWGVEVTLPRNFDYGQTGHRIRKTAAQWQAMGVRVASGGALPDQGEISILVPAGAGHVALAVYKNFRVIERYNPADAYVIGVGHLADRIGGASEFRGDWPVGDRALKFAERKELQQRLTAAGFGTGGVDGKVGPNTLNAVRAYQKSRGMIADGYVSITLLEKLRGR